MPRFSCLADLRRRRDLTAVGLCVALGLDGLLATALVVQSLQARPVLVLPSEEVVVPGEITDDAARSFARAYLLSFDTYTPSTIGTVTEWLKRRLSPRAWSGAAPSLDRREEVVREGRMASLVVPLDEGEIDRSKDVRVRFRARRTLFLSDQVSRETEAVYTIAMEMGPPDPGNPSGLRVLSQTVEEKSDEGRR